MTTKNKTTILEPDLTEIRRTVSLIVEPGNWTELRIPKTGKTQTVSGYFNTEHLDAMAQAAATWNGRAGGIYQTLNPVNPVLSARAENYVKPYAEYTTADADIIRREWLLVDFDPKRPAGISSTDAEHELALERARAARDYLLCLGFERNSIILANSGNGGHLLIRVDLPNDEAAIRLCQRLLQALDLRFTDGAVLVDTTTYNAARISKVYGTWACKGDNTSERPHRMSRILDLPETIVPASRGLLEQVASTVPVRSKTAPTSGQRIDLAEWLAKHSIDVHHTKLWNSGMLHVLSECPWNPEHNHGEAWAYQFPDGALAAGCHHNSCAQYGWGDLREKYESKYTGQAHTRNEPALESSKPITAQASLELPAIAWRGLFKHYRDMVGPTTEAADAFHYATFLQVFGCTIGRRLHVYHATRLYPNFYTCLVGRSGLTRKDTVWSRGSDILSQLHTEMDGEGSPPFRIVKGIRSYEGLLDELSGERKVRLIQVGELLSLLAKARQDSLSNIIPALNELYDCPDRVNPPVHQKSAADCREPFTSIAAGTTQAWLQKALTERDIYGGFANRWCYFYGLPKDPMPNPPKVDAAKRSALVQGLNQIRDWAGDVPNGETSISHEASLLFTDYYKQYYRRCQQDGLIPTLIVRIQDFIWKIALLYAADTMSETISGDHLEAAIPVGNYLEQSVTEVFASFGTSNGKAQESKLLDFLRSEGGPVPEREVYRRLSMSAKELESVVTPLMRIGLVKNSYMNTDKGRRVKTYEAVV